MNSNSCVIELKDIYKDYGCVKVLRGISFKVEKGDFTAIMGPSGSGKTTLMNIIGCLDTPTSGQYNLDGQEISRCSEKQLSRIRNLNIGFVFQKFNLLAKLSAFENVELPLIYRGIPGQKRREMTMEALNQVGLTDRIKHRPSELSGGQQQRVAIARAIAGDPPLILADEPTGNLDSKSGKEVMSVIDRLNADGKTIVLITHDSGVALRARRMVIIRDGSLSDDTEEVSGYAAV